MLFEFLKMLCFFYLFCHILYQLRVITLQIFRYRITDLQIYDNSVTVLQFENFTGGNYTHISKLFIKGFCAGQVTQEGESNEYLKSAITIRNTARLSVS